jgi:sec-independent protein translocase protein TatA
MKSARADFFKGGITMFGLGAQELIIIMFIVLIIFGGRKLPELGSGVGKAIRNFKNATHDANKEVEAPKD